ncbi:DUF402 domain-containing protein [Nocardioides sp. GCM10027113]|uniref:DUF402 domain-containing protein n=1 Tax=unclassified Nocardioides TaxID=2615069 RepID=UPI00360DFEBD
MTGRRRSGTPPYWSPGTLITYRWGDPAGPHFAERVRVVRDDADGLVTWLAAGTPVLRKARADGRPRRSDRATMFTAEVVQAEEVWTDYHVLRVAPTGRAWSVMHFFEAATGRFEGWYANIEDPHVRDADTVYSRDNVLDVWVEPDRSVHRKDEDELALAVAQGRYSAEEATGITAVADEIEAVVAAWGRPFRDGWQTFRPDPHWPLPALPDLPAHSPT